MKERFIITTYRDGIKNYYAHATGNSAGQLWESIKLATPYHSEETARMQLQMFKRPTEFKIESHFLD